MEYVKVLPVNVVSGLNTHRTFVVWGPCDALNNYALYQALGRYHPFTVVLTSSASPHEGVCPQKYSRPCNEAMTGNGVFAFLEDYTVYPLPTAVKAVRLAANALRSGRAVVVCCDSGIGRSNTVVYSILTDLTGKCVFDLFEELLDRTVVLKRSGRALLEEDGRGSDHKELFGVEHVVTVNGGPHIDRECCEKYGSVMGLDSDQLEAVCKSVQMQFILAFHKYHAFAEKREVS